jgi:hypothetical protein
MYKFDVKYTFDNYLEYYKFILIKQRILRDLIFALFFVGIAVYWWIDTSENTANNFLPIFAIVMGFLFPMMNFFTVPMLKKQLHARQAEIDRTHIVVTFNDDVVIYENLTVKPVVEQPVEEVKEETNENTTEEVAEVKEEAEVIDNTPVEENKEERVFKLAYQNFLSVKETANLFLFYLDRQTVIILPKATYVTEGELAEFKNFILTKVNSHRVKFLKK